MADRIFPSAEQDSLGSPKQINTIDWEKFAASLNTRVAESDDDEKMKKPGDDDADDADDADDDDTDGEGGEEGDDNEASTRTSAWKDLKNWLDKNKKKKGPKSSDDKDAETNEDDKEPDHDKDDEGPMNRKGKECKACGKMYSGTKCSCTAKKASQVVFTHPDQISAEALMTAKTAGNENLVRAILAAREDRNKVIEARLERLAAVETEKNHRLAQRREYRASIVAEADNASRLASVEATVTKDEEGFKSVASLKKNEKQVIAQRLIDNGFPVEYVEATLGMYESAPSISAEETQIREVMSSSLNTSTKRTAIAGLVKVAELSQEQLNRCIRFWVDELGYGDEEWVRDLFAKK